MKKVDVVRAWKDESYRQSLSQEQQAQLPQHPSGMIELTEVEMDQVAGGGTFQKTFCICVT